MSAQALLSLPNNAIIESGSFGETSGTIVFDKPFPNTPFVLLQNAQGSTWDSVIFIVNTVSTTGFTYIKYNTATPAVITNAINCNYIAVGFP
jgi:hypothetical protein